MTIGLLVYFVGVVGRIGCATSLDPVGDDLRVAFDDVLSKRLFLQRVFSTVCGYLFVGLVQAW